MLTETGDIAKENPIRYAGYYYDSETKDYYLKARYYNPANGTFLAMDPQPGQDSDPLSQNGYTYVENNPVSNADPDGESARLKYALRKGLEGVLASYIGWKNAGAIIAKVFGGVTTGIGFHYFYNAKKRETAKSISRYELYSGSGLKLMIKDAKRQMRKALLRKGLSIAVGGLAASLPDLWTFGYYAWKGWKSYPKRHH